MKKDLISIKDLSKRELTKIFNLTDRVKRSPHKFSQALKGKVLALIFQKPSCRTQVSFQVGIYQLGGSSLYLGPDQIKLGLRESIGDVGRTLSRYVDGIVLRTFAHKNILEMAECATIPVINALTDLLHPCQALGDLLTIREKKGKLDNLKLAYIGDGNNVAHSLMFGSVKVGMNIVIATPFGYEPKPEITKKAKEDAKKIGCKLEITNHPEKAVDNADIIYTDVWTSMGLEKESEIRKNVFKPYQINQDLISKAKDDVIILHCLPAHRGEEITDEVIDGPHSVVIDQAENRMHAQKAVLALLL